LIALTVGLGALGSTAHASEPEASDPPPTVDHIGPIQPDMLHLTVLEGRVIPGTIERYEPQPGDRAQQRTPTEYGARALDRDGQTIGLVLGRDDSHVRLPDRFEGQRLDRALIDEASSYRLSTAEGSDVPGVVRVYRKTSVDDLSLHNRQEGSQAQLRHRLYLQLDQPLEVGRTYTLNFADPLLEPARYVHEPRTTRSDAVHAPHIGFRPGDPAKFAYVSLWLGEGPGVGGGIDFQPGTPFEVIDQDSGESVFQGELQLRRRGDQDEQGRMVDYPDGRFNWAKVNVYEADFSSLDRPGRYRVFVEGVGCSYPFEIREDVWRDAFLTTLAGIYVHRSGMPVEVTSVGGARWHRPRGFHPDDGVVVRQSTAIVSDADFDRLVQGATEQEVPEAWGGYMDAGDWDRSSKHLNISWNLLDFVEQFPEYAGSLDLPIPDSAEVLPHPAYAQADLPDLLDEAVWGLDLFRRMQQDDGGVRGGIESAAHPRPGEPSWLESLGVYAWAVDERSSYYFAKVAAKAAWVLRDYNPQLAQLYHDAAVRAYDWAQAHPTELDEATLQSDYRRKKHHAPALAAAAELYRLTGETRYQDDLLAIEREPDETAGMIADRDLTDRDQLDAAWTYIHTDHPSVDQALRETVREHYLRTTMGMARIANERTAFGVLKFGWHPFGGAGAGTNPNERTEHVARAYLLTGDPAYRAAVVRGVSLGLGANPQNLAMITGLGHRSPQRILHVDSQAVGQTAPVGIALYGWNPSTSGVLSRHGRTFNTENQQAIVPDFQTWPYMENFHAHPRWWQMTEYVVDRNMSPTNYLLGFLDALPAER
jgi:endoglucanase